VTGIPEIISMMEASGTGHQRNLSTALWRQKPIEEHSELLPLTKAAGNFTNIMLEVISGAGGADIFDQRSVPESWNSGQAI
jgi:hypothetical protein